MTLVQQLKKKPLRVFVNQPSTLQPFHHLNQQRGIAVLEDEQVRIYFTEGDVFSQFIDPIALTAYPGQ